MASDLAETASPLRGLDAKYFTDPVIYDLVKKNIYFKTWQLACHSSLVSDVGDCFTFSIFDQEILIVRGQDRILRAMYNVCQHRGHILDVIVARAIFEGRTGRPVIFHDAPTRIAKIDRLKLPAIIRRPAMDISQFEGVDANGRWSWMRQGGEQEIKLVWREEWAIAIKALVEVRRGHLI